jgi:hypothetical protein
MADQEFVPSRRNVAGDRREYDDDYRREYRGEGGHGPIVTVAFGNGGGRDRGGRDCGNGRNDGERDEFPAPATTPLTGHELLDLRQQTGATPWWTKVYTSLINLFQSFFPQAYSWSGLNLKADTQNTPLFTTPTKGAMVWNLVYSCTCVSQDAGASNLTVEVLFTSADGTSSPISHTLVLTTANVGHSLATQVMLQPNTGVSFQATGGGTYGAAQYNLIVSAIPLCSDLPTNSPSNYMW